jgi:hypothetical protein
MSNQAQVLNILVRIQGQLEGATQAVKAIQQIGGQIKNFADEAGRKFQGLQEHASGFAGSLIQIYGAVAGFGKLREYLSQAVEQARAETRTRRGNCRTWTGVPASPRPAACPA